MVQGLLKWLRRKKKKIHLPMLETQVPSLDWKDPLLEAMATYCSFLAWKISWTEGPAGLQPMGSDTVQRVGHSWTTESIRAHEPGTHSVFQLKKMIKMQGLRPFRCLVNQSRMNKTEQNIQGLPAVWCSWKTLSTRRHCKKETTASGCQTTRGLLELPGRARIPSSRQV